MKKMKIRGKELKRIGYLSDRAISLALRLTGKHFRRSDKTEVLELLGKNQS
jgi:tRNA-splicing ligase RtcB (3'-phosphate/5'-hydroxy nucleic acid ligase)